jgi:membrane protease YdiL (CAAX protease family)
MTRGLIVALLHRLSILAVGGAAALVIPRGRELDGGAASFGFLGVLAVVQLAILYVGLGRPSVRQLGWRDLRARDVVLGLGGFALASGLIVALFAGLGRLDVAAFAARVAERTAGEELLYVCIGLLAAFTEESIYRGHLQSRLAGRWGVVTGILAGAAIFAVLHLQPAPLALAGKLGIGLVLGLLRERTGTLWAAGIAHASIWALFGMS